MAFSNYLVKIGNYTIPNKYIKYDSWSSIYETLDWDSYRDMTGKLHRNALSGRKIKVEFTTPYMYKSDWDALMTGIRGQFTDSTEQKGSVTAYIDELGDYVTQDAYLVNVNPKVAQNSPFGIIYQPTRICFIGY